MFRRSGKSPQKIITGENISMGAQQKAENLGLTFPTQEKGYLNLCAKAGNLLFTSGHVSDMKGKLGADLTVEQGYQAARDCVIKILQSVHHTHETLDGLRVIKLLGCVNSTLEFAEHHLVINGSSDLLHEIFGKEGDGWHARSALGFASLPTGPAVEVEAIFEIKTTA
jgi:enamine deaminase RidA (YjgF/YER057c/UK114 family)